MHNFTSFYYKELLQKMQISIFEKYIPLHGIQRNNADKRHGPVTMPLSHTEHHPKRLQSQGDQPRCVPAVFAHQLLPFPLMSW